MRRRDKLMIGISLSALVGVVILFTLVLWLLWHESIRREETLVGGLAAGLGARTESILLDTVALLDEFDNMPETRCSPAHLLALQDAAVSRPHIRAIGHWRATERLCGVGFLQTGELRPPRADRIYPSGVIAWWPGPHTEAGGVALFLMRFGDHDVAIDPRMLLDVDPLRQREAGLWVENLLLAAQPANAILPDPESLPIGLTIDREGGRLVSRFSHAAVMPIDVVAVEPIASFWERNLGPLLIGGGLGLVLSLLWVYAILRYTRHRLSPPEELREALAQEQITVFYQPVVELRSGRCVGAEALARWTREDGQSVPPDVFIPVAEQAGLVPQITLAVLRQVVRQLPDLLRKAPGLSINVNLCPEDLRDEEFGKVLADSLHGSKIPSSSIKLEITERALVNSETARNMIRTFRVRGHQVAVDDFGTGYSSLAYLQSFELDVLKIDKAFVDAIGTAAATSQVIVHVIEMARSLGLSTVAEGVQRTDQAEWLIEHGVEYGQGYLFSVPLSPAAFSDYLQNRAIP